MRRLLKFMNYAAQLMALIDIGKTIKRWATKNDTTWYSFHEFIEDRDG